MTQQRDDHDREEGDGLLAAAELITESQIAVIVRHTTGILCAPMPGDRAGVLGLPEMVKDHTDPRGTAFTVTSAEPLLLSHMSFGAP